MDMGLSPETVLKMAARILSGDSETPKANIDSETLSLLTRACLQSSTDVESLCVLSKSAKGRAREIVESRKKRRKRVARWRDQQYRDIAEWAGGSITFTRELVKSKPGRNGLYTLIIKFVSGDNDRGWRPPITVTLSQPDDTRIIYDPQGLLSWPDSNYCEDCDEEREDCGCSFQTNQIRVHRLSRMMKESLHHSNEAVPRFFGMGVPKDWSEGRVAEYLQDQKDALPAPPRRAQSYDDPEIRTLPIFKTLRKSIPCSIDDSAIVMMVRGNMAKEYADYQERENPDRYNLTKAPVASAPGRKLDLND